MKLLLDTNVLVLLCVGLADRDHVSSHKRTDAYQVEDFDLLVTLLGRFTGVMTVPHVLAEASNLLHTGFGVRRSAPLGKLEEFIARVEEMQLPSTEGLSVAEFSKLGLTDAILIAASEQVGTATTLTADVHLYLALERRGLPVINFAHEIERAGRL